MIYYSANCLWNDQLGRIPRLSFNVPVYDSNIDYIKGLKRYSLHYASVPLNYTSELVPGSKLNGKQVVISLEETCPSVCISMVLQNKLISLN